MRTLPLVAASAVGLLMLTDIAHARFVETWSQEELYQKSNLVVIATPTGNVDVKRNESFQGAQFRDIPD
jgi:hypothetical protein